MGEKEIKRVMVVEREEEEGEGGGGYKTSRLLVQPSAFFAGPPSLILRCESNGEFSFHLAIILYASICMWTGRGIKIQISLG